MQNYLLLISHENLYQVSIVHDILKTFAQYAMHPSWENNFQTVLNFFRLKHLLVSGHAGSTAFMVILLSCMQWYCMCNVWTGSLNNMIALFPGVQSSHRLNVCCCDHDFVLGEGFADKGKKLSANIWKCLLLLNIIPNHLVQKAPYFWWFCLPPYMENTPAKRSKESRGLFCCQVQKGSKWHTKDYFKKGDYFLFAYYSTRNMLLTSFLHNLKYCKVVTIMKWPEEAYATSVGFQKKRGFEKYITCFLFLHPAAIFNRWL